MMCIWKLDIYDNSFITGCDHAFCLGNDEILKDKAFKFCPYCGKKIKAALKEKE